jgi:hypothetical protein
MLHADYWFRKGMEKWPVDAIMTPFMGSHDTARFVTLADYRGQDAAHDRAIPGNAWNNTAVAPGDAEPYRRSRIAMAWLLGLPGAPLLYYGDEYGEWGGADPNNRHMWRPPGSLSADEAATLQRTRLLGAARRALPAMRRGTYSTLSVDDDTLIFGRRIPPAGAAALVGLTRLGTAVTRTFDVHSSLGWQPGTALSDSLGGPGGTVSPGGQLTLTIPASGAVLLHPSHAPGDVNADGQVNVSDVLYLINFLFAGGPAPIGLGDSNGDGVVNVSDVLYLINFLFAGGPAPQ